MCYANENDWLPYGIYRTVIAQEKMSWRQSLAGMFFVFWCVFLTSGRLIRKADIICIKTFLFNINVCTCIIYAFINFLTAAYLFSLHRNVKNINNSSMI